MIDSTHKEDDIGRGASSIAGTLDGNSAVGSLERRSIIHAVTWKPAANQLGR